MFLEPLSELRWAYQLHYYLCFRTRWRHLEFLTANKEASISQILAEVCANHDYHLLRHKIYPDHVRCLLSLKASDAISRVINKLKSNLSREFCSEYRQEPPLWATGYLARSVGRVRIEAVKRYLAYQSEHHGYSARINPPVFRYRSEKPVALTSAHAVFDLNYHLVLATRYRKGIFGSALGRNLVTYWLRVAKKWEFAIDRASILPDHAHLMVRLKPSMSIQECALSLMNNSQNWMGTHHRSALIQASVDSLWQPSAYAGTCGKVTTAMVKAFLSK